MVAAYFLLPLDSLGPHRPAVSWSVFLVSVGVVAVLLLRQITAVTLERRDTRPGLVIPLLMCLSVLVFAAAYYGLAKQPGEFAGLRTRLDALYFTLVTLATIGFGDITPQGQGARFVTMLQILFNFVFLTAAATSLTRHVRGRVGERHGRRGGPGDQPR
ncbi:two pore domain potassium channel family protein [Streptomyces ficellus]|uniref:Two pore domain potassium channel family protein n=1 Tax=Streptomyces ficellus TaxID=1977088 RepID=A0A6I6FRM5_9ACTN|nr:two pore domain potassium channel family protein [Streptomyces ficellus]